MTIRFTEARFGIGPIKIGTKLGEEAPVMGILLSVSVPHWGRIEFPHRVRVYARGSDEVLVKGVERLMCRECEPQILARDQINTEYAWVSKRIRWTEN